MAEQIVIDTGPLVALHRIGRLYILDMLPFNFLCPAEVRRELDEGQAAGHPRIGPSLSSYPPIADAMNAATSFLSCSWSTRRIYIMWPAS